MRSKNADEMHLTNKTVTSWVSGCLDKILTLKGNDGYELYNGRETIYKKFQGFQ